MDLKKFYFTYGSYADHPYSGGWTEVWAPNSHLACLAFREVHPDRITGVLNCASVYAAEDFAQTRMAGPDGNFGYRCWETITINLTVTVRREEVME